MTMASREISRLVAIFATILLIQIAIVPHFRISGYIIDLPLVVLVLVGLHLNPPNGALVGFIVGFAIDLVVHTPFGMTALTFSVAGYAAGSASGQLTERNILTRALTVALLAATATSLFAAVAALIGLEYVTRQELGAIALVTAASTLPLTLLLAPLVRWAFPLETVQLHE